MPYVVTCHPDESVLVLKSQGEFLDREGKHAGYDHRNDVHLDGDVISDEEISPVLVKLYEDGDAHVRSVLRKEGDEEKAAERKPRNAVKTAEDGLPDTPLSDQARRNPLPSKK